jgi:hypothetical protein
MRRNALLLGVLGSAALLTGCVDRRFVIESNPPGAVVLVNGQQIGATPVDYHFIYYGKYEITLIKDGFQTRKVEQEVPAPWYEFFPIDFFSENLWPGRVVDVRNFHYDLEPVQAVRTDVLLEQAQHLRTRGQSLVSPPAPSEPPPPLPAAAGLVPPPPLPAPPLPSVPGHN